MKLAIILCLVTFISSTSSVIAKDIGSAVSNSPGMGGNNVPDDVLPPARGETPEDAALKKIPPPAKKENIRRPTKAELDGECRKEPECAKQMKAAQGGSKGKKSLPAATSESPEEIELKKLPQPANMNRPPHSEVVPSQLDALLSRLNPIGAAEAASFTISPTQPAEGEVSAYLTPSTSGDKNKLSARMYAYGVLDYSYARSRDYYLLYPSMISTNMTYTENKPFVRLSFYAPTAAYYKINFSASRGTAQLKHQNNGPIIMTWDYKAKSCNPCNYQVIKYFSAGHHNLYYWTKDSYQYVYSAAIEHYK